MNILLNRQTSDRLSVTIWLLWSQALYVTLRPNGGFFTMTFAMSLKVGDGIVMAADSASTMMTVDDQGRPAVSNIYRNANKVINLVKGLPIGVCVWGLGGIGSHSVEFLLKELRVRLTQGTTGYEEWKLDRETYTLEAVANRVRQFLYEEEYLQHVPVQPGKSPTMGVLVAGYSAAARSGEIYVLNVDADGQCAAPTRVSGQNDLSTLTFDGQTDAVQRLLAGFSPSIGRVLVENLGFAEKDVPQIASVLNQRLRVPLFDAQMPIQDAIDLAEFLVDVSAKFARFMPQPESVAGEIEIAAITKHEGFKWVRRKHYYHASINPVSSDH